MNFKVGDWVTRYLDSCEIAADVKSAKIHDIKDEQYVIKLPSGMFVNYLFEHLKLWQPKAGEWCWFWNNNEEETAVVSKFIEIDATESYKSSIIFAHCYISFDFCEPFIGELPSFLKE